MFPVRKSLPDIRRIQNELKDRTRVALTRSAPVPVKKIGPCGFGVIHLIIPVGWTKQAHWIGCTVPGDPEMCFSVDVCLLEVSQAFEISSDGETHGKDSDFDYPGNVRHLHSEPNPRPCQVPGREVLEK